MGNCCTRVKEEEDKAPKRKISENVKIINNFILYLVFKS